MRATTIPDVVRALKALWVPLVAPVRVSVGPPVGDLPDRYLAIAYGGDDRPGIIGVGKPVPGMNYTDARGEEFVIWCTASTATGDQDGMKRMDATAAVLGVATNAVLLDPHLGTAVRAPGTADIGEIEWTVEDEGSVATVFFQVRVNQEMFV